LRDAYLQRRDPELFNIMDTERYDEEVQVPPENKE